jgi:Lon protease-like protein
MINFIPIFPLSTVVFPGEQLNLHIFEPRYIQLVNECAVQKKPFGIPVVVKNKVEELGTLVEIKEIAKTYDDGKLDIRTEGTAVFRILEIVKELPEKLYSGAIVDYPQNNFQRKEKITKLIIKGIRELHTLLNLFKDFSKPDDQLNSYDMAHHAALSLEEEYEFLGLLREDQRLEYLKRHLNNIIPSVAGVEGLAKRVKLNGHFRELKGFNFDF